MAGGLFTRLKNWAFGENIASADLNAEFNNILNNAQSSKLGGYSATVPQMQIQTSPGAQGSESLAISESDELERLRFVLNRIIGGTYWYDAPVLSISDVNTLISQGNLTPPPNRITSGLKRASSNQPAFLVADGTAATSTLKGSGTPFVFRVAGTAYTISSDVALTSMVSASSSATALINDTTLTAQDSSKYQGEGSTSIVIDSQSGNFTSDATVNSYQAFKVVHSGVTEYFFGYMKDANTITKCYRGFFFDKNSAPIGRLAIADEDTVTLMRLHWVFANTNGTLSSMSSKTTNPIWSFATPSAPSTGDYWFDMSAKIWKTFNGSSFVASNSMLIGIAIVDSAGICQASRSFEFYAPYSDKNTVLLELQDVNNLRSTVQGAQVSVAGNLQVYDKNLLRWNMPSSLDSGVSEASNTFYYAYVKDTGDLVFSDVKPYDRRSDLGGKYHPYNPWRSVGFVKNDGSSNFSGTAGNLISETYSDADNIGMLMTSVGANALISVSTRPVSNAQASTPFGNIGLGAGTAGTFTTTSTSDVTVTGCSVPNFQTNGRPIELRLINDNSVAASFVQVSGGSSPTASISFFRDSNLIGIQRLGEGSTVSADVLPFIPSSAFSALDTNLGAGLPANTYTYTVKAHVSAGATLNIANTTLMVCEKS